MNRKRLAAIATSVAIAAGSAGAVIATAPAASAATSCSGTVIDTLHIPLSNGDIGVAKLYYSNGYNCVYASSGGATEIAKLLVGDSQFPSTAGPGTLYTGDPATGNKWANNKCIKFGASFSGQGGFTGSGMSSWGHCV